MNMVFLRRSQGAGSQRIRISSALSVIRQDGCSVCSSWCKAHGSKPWYCTWNIGYNFLLKKKWFKFVVLRKVNSKSRTVQNFLRKSLLKKSYHFFMKVFNDFNSLTCVTISRTSRRKDCGMPPLKPSEHRTPNEVSDAFTTVQLWTWSGRP